MSRCIGCNRILDLGTLKMTDPETGEPEDMCGWCREKSRSEYNYMYDHAFHHETVVEGLSTKSKAGYYYDWVD